jgi:uridine kinase
MIEVDAAIALLQGRPDLRLVAIDGLPVSGKSTLADRIATELGAAVLYLDDFVRPEAEWRGLVQPAFPFPYIRYSAFQQAVQSLARGEPAHFERYDWAKHRPSGEWREIIPGPLVVVEGVSALHPELAKLYDLRLWMQSDASSTLAASLARGVGEWEREWRELFLPSVELYLATKPRRRADYLVRGRGVPAS